MWTSSFRTRRICVSLKLPPRRWDSGSQDVYESSEVREYIVRIHSSVFGGGRRGRKVERGRPDLVGGLWGRSDLWVLSIGVGRLLMLWKLLIYCSCSPAREVRL